MIDIQKDTPIEYSKQSRDYQVFSFLYSSIFNQIKLYADQIKNIWTDNIDDKLILPRSYTLNFIPKYDWDNNDLRGVTNNFRYLVRTKGTVDAIKACLEILARVHNSSLQGIDVEVIGPGRIRIILGEEIADLGVIEDLLRYILPAGLSYEIIRYAEISSALKPTRILVNSKFEELESYDNLELYIPHLSYDPMNPTNPPQPPLGGYQEYYAIHSPSNYNYNTRYEPGMLVSNGKDNNFIINVKGKTLTEAFNGTMHSVSGYTSSSTNPEFDQTKLHYRGSVPTATGVNAGVYYMGLTYADFYYDDPEAIIVVEDGYLRITSSGSITINIVGNTRVETYNGYSLSVTGYTATSTNQYFNESKLRPTKNIVATGTNAGIYQMNLKANNFIYEDSNFEEVIFDITDGFLQIVPITTSVLVDIYGNTAEFTYDGKEHSVSGYTITATNSLYKINFIQFNGVKSISAIAIGTYTNDTMLPGNFENISSNFTNVSFNVKNRGTLVIKRA